VPLNTSFLNHAGIATSGVTEMAGSFRNMKWLDKLAEPVRALRAAYNSGVARGDRGFVERRDAPRQYVGSYRGMQSEPPGINKAREPVYLSGDAKMLVTTRAQLITDLRNAGITEAAIAAVARATAPARHERRVAEVFTALGGAPTAGPTRARFMMQLICELHGVGGTADLEGTATLRMPWARELGKGRKHATDGGAWTAAILATFWRYYRQFLAPSFFEQALTIIRPEISGFVVVLTAEAAGQQPVALGTWIPSPAEVRWARALALRALLVALELPTPAPAPSFTALKPHPAFEGSALVWSRLLERLDEMSEPASSAEGNTAGRSGTPALDGTADNP
jgi:hypothetical protein